MKDLKNYGVQELEANEKQKTIGGNPIITWLEVVVFYIEHFDSDVLPISNDSTGSALDGYMGSRM